MNKKYSKILTDDTDISCITNIGDLNRYKMLNKFTNVYNCKVNY